MNHLEEKLWNYIDGQCSPAVQLEIEALLEKDPQVNALYQELLKVNHALSALEIDEPSMSFTRNVMERVEGELKPVALKTKVDQRIVKSIFAFFALSLLAILVYAFATSAATSEWSLPKMDLTLSINKYFTSQTFKVFLLVDVVLFLVFIDSMIRRKKLKETKKGA